MTQSGLCMAVALAAILAAGGASAQQNTLDIEQIGGGNTLTVDQSAAVGSNVGGLEILGGVQAPVLLLDALDDLPLEPPAETARQSGDLLEAEISAAGEGGVAVLFQDNSNALSPLGNFASIDLLQDGASALVAQVGDSNTATVTVSGVGAFGATLQEGDNNIAGVSVEGPSSSGTVIQQGSFNQANLNVLGVGSNVVYQQIGDNVQPVGLQGVSVITNAVNVTITQTQLP